MPSRRISSISALAPVQEIAVNAYSAFNSDNVNMLTRIVTGQKNKDVVVSGLDLRGVNTVLAEVLDDTPFISDFFDYAGSTSSFQSNWGTPVNFEYDSSNITASIPSGTYATASIQSEIPSPSTDVGFWFKVQFNLTGLPKTLYFQFGSETKVYEYPEAGDHSFYIQLYNDGGTFENFKIVAQLDATSDPSISIDSLIVTKVWNKATEIQPISLPEANSPDTYNEVQLNHNNIQTPLLHPHTQLNVYPGVAVKDEAVVTITGTQMDQPALVLTYSDPDSWISGVPFGVSDFPEGTETKYLVDGDLTEQPGATFDASGLLTGVTLSDDGFISSPYYTKISGNSNVGHAVVKWAYVCLYYSYFKNPDPNRSYIGLVKEEELTDAKYGEDYLVLGKLRFVDAQTVDAIIYYPDRPDLAYIDATRVTYLHLNQLKHWLNKPVNVSLALDLVASRIYNWKGVLYFPTHSDFIDWTNRVQGSATGHGPADFEQWIDGIDPQNGYDLLAFVVETNTFFKSKVSTYDEKYVLSIQWEEIALKTFEVNWSGLNMGAWPISKPSNWIWYDADGGSDVNPQPILKTHDEAIAAYPNYYYIEVCGGTELHHTIVNPYNPEGRGTVPGPLAAADGNSDVKLNKFLRADGTWQFAGGGGLHFYIQGYLVVAELAQMIIERSMVLNTVKVYVDNVAGTDDDPEDIEITISQKHYSSGWGSPTLLCTVTIPYSEIASDKIVSKTFDVGATAFAENDILLINCTAKGTTPNDGGSNTSVTVYYA